MSARTPTVQDIEASGKWVSAKSSGKHPETLREWRNKGLFRHGEVQRQRCLVSCGGQLITMPTYFYRPAAIERVERSNASKAKAKRHRHFASPTMMPYGVDDQGRPEHILRWKAACEYLDVSKPTLWAWTRPHGVGCHFIGGAKLRITKQPFGATACTCWFRSQLDEVIAARSKLKPMPDDPSAFTVAEAANTCSVARASALTGKNANTLTLLDEAERLGLERRFISVIEVVDGPKKRKYLRRSTRLRFTGDTVKALAPMSKPTLPAGRMTLRRAAKLLGLSRPEVLLLFHQGILNGEMGVSIPTRTGARKGIVVTRESVYALKRRFNAAGAMTRRDKRAVLKDVRREHEQVKRHPKPQPARLTTDGATATPSDGATVTPTGEGDDSTAHEASSKRGRGRPPGKTRFVEDHEKRIIESWDCREHGENTAEYARAFHRDRSYVWKLIREHERLKEKPSDTPASSAN
jgi:hypothetical protein